MHTHRTSEARTESRRSQCVFVFVYMYVYMHVFSGNGGSLDYAWLCVSVYLRFLLLCLFTEERLWWFMWHFHTECSLSWGDTRSLAITLPTPVAPSSLPPSNLWLASLTIHHIISWYPDKKAELASRFYAIYVSFAPTPLESHQQRSQTQNKKQSIFIICKSDSHSSSWLSLSPPASSSPSAPMTSLWYLE